LDLSETGFASGELVSSLASGFPLDAELTRDAGKFVSDKRIPKSIRFSAYRMAREWERQQRSGEEERFFVRGCDSPAGLFDGPNYPSAPGWCKYEP
jgi:hypothetical protein